MITAIYRGKACRSFNGIEFNWNEIFSGSEDTLTASVFERLFYLPTDLFWNILRESCYGNHLPNDCGALISKEFWPRWDAQDTNNSNFIEPDVFIQFEKFNLIIEAKRYDKNQQKDAQWCDQIKAYKNTHSKKLYYIALGGIRSENDERIEDVTIVKCQWSRILSIVKRRLNLITTDSDLSGVPVLLRSIFEDLILAFSIHGFAVGEWFESMPQSDLSINNQSILTLSELTKSKKTIS